MNGALGLASASRPSGSASAALILAAAIYVSSSAITVKGLIDFRRLADDETDLVLAILVAEDLVIALVLGFGAAAAAGSTDTLVLVAKAIAFMRRRWRCRSGSAARSTACSTGCRGSSSCWRVLVRVRQAALAERVGLSEAIGALMAGVVLSETSVREEIEERFFSFRDVFAALFFFVFGLSIDVGAIGSVGWLLAAAVVAALVGKVGGGYMRGLVGGLSRRQSFNVGAALVAHGEFTIILAQLASDERPDLAAPRRRSSSLSPGSTCWSPRRSESR